MTTATIQLNASLPIEYTSPWASLLRLPNAVFGTASEERRLTRALLVLFAVPSFLVFGKGAITIMLLHTVVFKGLRKLIRFA